MRRQYRGWRSKGVGGRETWWCVRLSTRWISTRSGLSSSFLTWDTRSQHQTARKNATRSRREETSLRRAPTRESAEV
eukprot:1832678-Rhodomonas_salina.2